MYIINDGGVCYTPVGLTGLRELSLDNALVTDEGIKYITGALSCALIDCEHTIVYTYVLYISPLPQI